MVFLPFFFIAFATNPFFLLMFILLAEVENDRLAFKLRADLSPINVIHNLKRERKKIILANTKTTKSTFSQKGFEEWVGVGCRLVKRHKQW